MRSHPLCQARLLFCIVSFLLAGCSNQLVTSDGLTHYSSLDPDKYSARLPQAIEGSNEKVILVDPKVYAWGAYNENGELIRGGIATAGGEYCPDDGAPCRTSIGTFRITSLGDEGCTSRTYPRPKGGSLMPYCMFFNGGQSFHGSPDSMLVEANISHGCVHMRIPDAEWLRYNFAKVGTKVVVLPY